MHEYPITEHIVKLANTHAEENGAQKVTAINLVMGDNCGYLPDSIILYFDIIAENTACCGAKINIRNIAPRLECDICGELFERKPFTFDCPRSECGGQGKPTEIGREFFIESIEVD